jgi:hypothetical protein
MMANKRGSVSSWIGRSDVLCQNAVCPFKALLAVFGTNQ